jgi:hypothetical protein
MPANGLKEPKAAEPTGRRGHSLEPGTGPARQAAARQESQFAGRQLKVTWVMRSPSVTKVQVV